MRTLCILVLIGSTLAANAESLPERGTTLQLPEPASCTADVRDQVTTAPRAPLSRPGMPVLPRERLEGYHAVDSLMSDLFIPAGAEHAVHFDHAGLSLTDTLQTYTLTEDAWAAIEIAPAWLREDLEWSFSRLYEASQNTYAALLLNLDDPRTIDEVAFQIAHLSYSILLNYVDPPLLEINAKLMYQIDQELQYVEILDYDEGGGEFYSTTRYRTMVDGEITLVEIPREYYYWWIVMPKVSDEVPLMDETVYDDFWRYYLFYRHDRPYPILQEVMQPITVLWDGLEHNWPGGRAFHDSMLAVDVVGNWCSETVPDAASGDRPIQPNIIAHGHNGNCGELQDLLCAAARTCLIPAACSMDILEDHVWCEMWLDDWHPYQVDLGRGPTRIDNHGIAYDADYGGGKDVSCIWNWRGDGYTWDVVARYSAVCTLTVAIDDPNGLPVDNASVVLASESYYPPYSLGRGTWGETDADGIVRFILGNNQNYYVKVTTSLGSYPASGYASIITGSVAGEHYSWNWTTPDALPQLAVGEDPSGTDADYVLEVELTLPYDVQSGRDQYASPPSYYAEKLMEGKLDFFVADAGNFFDYLEGNTFTAYEVNEDLSTLHLYFHPPVMEDYYVVLSSLERHGLAARASLQVRLWERDTGAVTDGADCAGVVRLCPHPVREQTTVRFAIDRSGPVCLRLFDPTGRLVSEGSTLDCAAGVQQLSWNRGTQPAGTYFMRIQGPGLDVGRTVTLLR